MKVDRISKLPDGMLSQILSFLPTEEAVDTSLLSKRWKYLFASLTNLHFDYPSSSLLVGSQKEKGESENISSFLLFVDKVLLFHNPSSIRSFYVHCREPIDGCRVNAWVRAALCLNVQELDFCVSLQKFTMPPTDLFTSSTLVVLKLELIFEINVSPSLKVLHLKDIKFADNDSFGRLISSCPVLEDFVIGPCYMGVGFEI
ncbi:LRR_2 domain-containing protein [Cephalotus follicularis]|uniref:LRR_2 domain-containing protein n=1 Tax=Cephalotus follicularis TaxID=3775 RepID=A0A1Q3AYK8_CEPFO|nr:LRR_2 domain-containing protein [Cephalotus follicularis]